MRLTPSTLVTAVAAVVTATAATAPRAEATDQNCWLGVGAPIHWPIPLFATVVDVPVYLNTSASHGYQWSGYSSSDYLYSVRAAIHRWNEQAGSRVRLRYAGTVSLGRLDQVPSPPAGVILYGVYPTSAGNAEWCFAKAGSALPIDVDGDYETDYAWLAIAARDGNCNPNPQEPGELVDLLTHEFGHALGRNDAYSGASGEQCGLDHFTIMDYALTDPTLFDQLELQSVYGRRTTGTSRRRLLTYSGGAWGSPSTLDATARLSRPGPSSSYRTGSLQMAWRDMVTSGVMRVVRRMVPYAGSPGALTAETLPVSSPVAIAHAPDGTAVMAYVRENPMDPLNVPRVCWKVSTNSGGTYGAETCGGDTITNGVALAYDPPTQMFVLGYTELDGSIGLRSIRSWSAWYPERSGTWSDRSGAQGVAIACSDQSVSGNNNCRVVYASRNHYGQRIAWFPLAVTFNGFSVGAEVTTSLYAQTVPAVAWFHNRFHLAFGGGDNTVYHYDMPRTGTSWTWRSTPVTATNQTTSWASPPYLASATECNGDICATVLELIWLQYQ